MSRTARRVLTTVLIAALLIVSMSELLSAPTPVVADDASLLEIPEPVETGRDRGATRMSGVSEVTAADEGDQGSDAISQGRRHTYAISVLDLAGLPPDARPGTIIELWVAWDPPVTKSAQVQRLLKNVVLERIIPGPVVEAPSMALLSVLPRQVPDLLYGDRYGSLSVTVLPR
ncbi:MAG TPA: hypothetical protein VNC78_05270 [Actinomycetota bacterium]|nr:hypothetical protein [Actinomycetota bacterium]